MHMPGRFQGSRLALVTWGHFLNDYYGSFFAPILPLLIDKLSLSLIMASRLASIGSVPSAVFQPIYGMASDRMHGRLFIVIGPLLSIVCMSLIAVAPNAVLVGVLLLLAGISSAAFHPQAVAAAGVLLIGFGTLAEMIGVSRALDIAATLPLLTAGLALALPNHTPAETGKPANSIGDMVLESK
jgi:MFS family permease